MAEMMQGMDMSPENMKKQLGAMGMSPDQFIGKVGRAQRLLLRTLCTLCMQCACFAHCAWFARCAGCAAFGGLGSVCGAVGGRCDCKRA